LPVGLSSAAKLLDLKGRAPVPRVQGASGSFDRVAGTRSETARSLTPALSVNGRWSRDGIRRRAVPGWEELSTPLPTRALAPAPDQRRQARLDPTRQCKEINLGVKAWSMKCHWGNSAGSQSDVLADVLGWMAVLSM
jgi:hypothetical protein